ncbi:MAG: SET domain-containing protein-lysine N-methyltransferase [Myxococcota bacterium]
MHPDTDLRFVRPEIGVGIFATKLIPKGTITWVPDKLDTHFTPQQFAEMPPAMQKVVDRYSFVESNGDYVLCWDHARYMNHSCRPNVRALGELVDIAVRDIQPGEELTCDYAGFNMAEDFECRCGEPTCRGVLQTNALWESFQTWDAEVASAASVAGSVPQVLMPLAELTPAKLRLIEGLLKREPVTLPSIRSSWCTSVVRANSNGAHRTGT